MPEREYLPAYILNLLKTSSKIIGKAVYAKTKRKAALPADLNKRNINGNSEDKSENVLQENRAMLKGDLWVNKSSIDENRLNVVRALKYV